MAQRSLTLFVKGTATEEAVFQDRRESVVVTINSKGLSINFGQDEGLTPLQNERFPWGINSQHILKERLGNLMGEKHVALHQLVIGRSCCQMDPER